MPVQVCEATLATTQPNFSPCYCHSATRKIALPFLPYLQTHIHTHTQTHIHTIYCQCFTVGPISLCFLLPLPSSIPANLFTAQIVSPISCSQYLPRTLSMSFHAPFNPHTSIHLTVTHHFINNAQSVYIYPVLGVSDTHLFIYTRAWCLLPLTHVLFADRGGLAV